MYFYYGSCGFVRKLKCSSLTFLIIDSHGASYADRGKKRKKNRKKEKNKQKDSNNWSTAMPYIVH